MQKEIELIKNKYLEIAKNIKAPDNLVFFYDIAKDLGYPHIEYSHGVFFYVITERGVEFERRSTNDPNKILFWIVKDLTSSMASEYELKHRVKNQDSRIIRFNYHIELLSKINENWAEVQSLEYKKILQKHPFVK